MIIQTYNHLVKFNIQDVSDRIEKTDSESEALLNLEKGGECVYYKGDWRPDIDAEVLEDLGKYRSYRGDSIRDLLRALRNKVINFNKSFSMLKLLQRIDQLNSN